MLHLMRHGFFICIFHMFISMVIVFLFLVYILLFIVYRVYQIVHGQDSLDIEGLKGHLSRRLQYR